MSKWIELVSENIRPESLGVNFPYLNTRDLLPLAIICGISILLITLWLLTVCEYIWFKSKYPPKSYNGHNGENDNT
jgi:hypothetical protein